MKFEIKSITNLIFLRFADMLIGGMESTTRGLTRPRLFASSTVYMRNERTWCVSRAKPIPVWLNLWRIATNVVWWLAISTIYLEGLVLYWFMRYERCHVGLAQKDFHYCVLTMAMPVFCGMSMTYRPRSKRMKAFIVLMLITGILISTAWNAFLIKVLTSPSYYTQISTVLELIENDFNLIGTVFTKEMMLQQPSKVKIAESTEL